MFLPHPLPPPFPPPLARGRWRAHTSTQNGLGRHKSLVALGKVFFGIFQTSDFYVDVCARKRERMDFSIGVPPKTVPVEFQEGFPRGTGILATSVASPQVNKYRVLGAGLFR